MIGTSARMAVGAVAASTMTLLASTAALAHTQQTVGPYKLTVGWVHEPVYVGYENAVQLFIHDSKGQPVDGVTSDALKIEVKFGSQSTTSLSLNPSFDPDTGLGTHGEYDAPFIPTAAGAYTFHFTGKISGSNGDQNVDLSLMSSDKTFNSAETPASVQFPAKVPTGAELAQRLDTVNSRIDNASSSEQSDSNHNQALAWVAIAIAVLLGGGGLVMAMMRKRPAA